MATTGSASLSQMTVASDTGASTGAALLMPKLQFRFRINFLNFGGAASTTPLTKQVIDCSRPQVQFQEITLPIYNSTMYLAGKATWQTLTMNLRDDASNTVTSLVGAQLQKQMDFAEQASAATGQDYKFQTNIDILDGGNGASAPVVLETWQLYGCFIQTANYNTLNYGTNEVVTISLTLRFDNAVQFQGTTSIGVGGALARAAGSSLATGVGGK